MGQEFSSHGRNAISLKGKKMSKKYLTEIKNWGINDSKWKAAKEFCRDRGWSFYIFTEKELGIK